MRFNPGPIFFALAFTSFRSTYLQYLTSPAKSEQNLMRSDPSILTAISIKNVPEKGRKKREEERNETSDTVLLMALLALALRGAGRGFFHLCGEDQMGLRFLRRTRFGKRRYVFQNMERPVEQHATDIFGISNGCAAAACIAICRMRSQTIRVGVPSNLCRLAANAM